MKPAMRVVKSTLLLTKTGMILIPKIRPKSKYKNILLPIRGLQSLYSQKNIILRANIAYKIALGFVEMLVGCAAQLKKNENRTAKMAVRQYFSFP